MLACTSCLAQSSYLGLTPGRSMRSDVESALGQPVRVLNATEFEYSPPEGIAKVGVQYRAGSAVAERIDVYLLQPVLRSALIQKFNLPESPAAKGTNAEGKVQEFFGEPKFLVFIYASAEATSGVTALGYYSRELFARTVPGGPKQPEGGAYIGPSSGTIPAKLLLKEGTEVPLQFADKLSSKTVAEGDSVHLTLAEDLNVGDQVVAKKASQALATVSHARKAG